MTTKPKYKKSRSSGLKPRIDPTVWVAIVGLIGTVTVAMLNFQPLSNWANSILFPTATPTQTTIVANPSETATFQPTDTTDTVQAPIPTLTETLTPIVDTPPPDTSQTAGDVMNAQLSASASTGHAPLLVNFNAKGSFLSHPDGTRLDCIQKNVCTYSWDVRSGSTMLYGPVLGGGEFSYTFSRKGDYVVVVYVCRGQTCNYAAASISVK